MRGPLIPGSVAWLARLRRSSDRDAPESLESQLSTQTPAETNKIFVSSFKLHPKTIPTTHVHQGRLSQGGVVIQQPGQDLERFGRMVRGIINSLIRHRLIRFVGMDQDEWQWEIDGDELAFNQLIFSQFNNVTGSPVFAPPVTTVVPTAPPAGGEEGAIVVYNPNNSTATLYVWTGTSWSVVGETSLTATDIFDAIGIGNGTIIGGTTNWHLLREYTHTDFTAAALTQDIDSGFTLPAKHGIHAHLVVTTEAGVAAGATFLTMGLLIDGVLQTTGIGDGLTINNVGAQGNQDQYGGNASVTKWTGGTSIGVRFTSNVNLNTYTDGTWQLRAVLSRAG